MEELRKQVYERLKVVYDWDMDNLTEAQKEFINDVIRETANGMKAEKVPDLPGRQN